MLVRQLNIGDTFRLDFGRGEIIDYKLIYVNDCRAFVEPLKKKKDLLDDEERKSGGRINISPNTECEILFNNDDFLEDDFMSTAVKDLFDDDDDFLGVPTPTPTVARTATVKKMTDGPKQKRSRDGSRKKEPGIQTREIKDGTVRAKLFAAMKTTKSIAKLMEKTGMEKNLLLSHVNDIWRHHGFGYTVEGDRVELIPPKSVKIKK